MNDRFIIIEDKYIYDTKYNTGFIGVESVCKYMNEMERENQDLYKTLSVASNKDIIRINLIKELQDELKKYREREEIKK